MKTDKKEILAILQQEGLTGEAAEAITRQICEGDALLEHISPARVDLAILNRVENVINRQLAQGRFIDNRYGLFKRMATIAATILIVVGGMWLYQNSKNESLNPTVKKSSVTLLLEDTEWSEFVFTDQEELEVDEEALTELMMLYEEPKTDTDSILGKELNNEKDNITLWNGTWYCMA